MTFGESLKRFRESRGLSQAAVANSLGVKTPLYQRYEWGKTSPSVEFVIKMATTFDVSADYLLGLRDTPKPNEVGADEVREARAFRESLKKFVEGTAS